MTSHIQFFEPGQFPSLLVVRKGNILFTASSSSVQPSIKKTLPTSAVSLARIRVEVVGPGTDVVGRDVGVEQAALAVRESDDAAHLQLRRLVAAVRGRSPSADGHPGALERLPVVERQASDVDRVGDGRRRDELQQREVVVFAEGVVLRMVDEALDSDEHFSVTLGLKRNIERCKCRASAEVIAQWWRRDPTKSRGFYSQRKLV